MLKLSLKKVKNEDCELIYSWILKKRVRIFLSSFFRQKKINLQMIKILTKKLNSKWYLIRSNNENVGCLILDDIDFDDKIANIWYFIGNDNFLRKNISFKVIKNFLKANPVKLHAVTAWASSNNKSSNNLLLKLKFIKIAKIPKTFKISKDFFDRVLYFKSLI